MIASGLDPSRYEPLVLLPDDGPLAADLQGDGVEVMIEPLAIIRRGEVNVVSLLASARRAGRRLSRLIRDRRIALVHSNTSVILGGGVACALARVPHVWHVRESYERFPRLWPVYRRVLGTARALPCVSQSTAAQFGKRSPVRVIYDGLAVNAGRAPREQARKTLGLAADAPVIAVVGRVSDWKGQDVLVRALAEPQLRDRGARGLIAGEPWPGAEDRLGAVLELADRVGVRDRLDLVGFREDVATVYGGADLIAVPSTAPDPLPGAATEAAAAGCAVIASETGGLPEIIADGRTGRLVPPGDPTALADIAAELLDDPAQRERLGSAAAEDVRERFRPDRLLDSIQDLYDEVLR